MFEEVGDDAGALEAPGAPIDTVPIGLRRSPSTSGFAARETAAAGVTTDSEALARGLSAASALTAPSEALASTERSFMSAAVGPDGVASSLAPSLLAVLGLSDDFGRSGAAAGTFPFGAADAVASPEFGSDAPSPLDAREAPELGGDESCDVRVAEAGAPSGRSETGADTEALEPPAASDALREPEPDADADEPEAGEPDSAAPREAALRLLADTEADPALVETPTDAPADPPDAEDADSPSPLAVRAVA